MMGSGGSREDDGENEKGLLWKLPILGTQQLGKVGPAFGLDGGCGLGFGIGFLGGAGFGPGIPGLQVGLGLVLDTGISPASRDLPTHDDIGALVEELVDNTKKLFRATTKEIDKWRR
ncbi:hypothetical protein ACFX2G_034953 [Malus domestica]